MGVTIIDAYLSTVSVNQRVALETLRRQIRAAAPDAEECISYGQPAFRHGRVICGFGAAARHCALYLFSATTLVAFVDELDGFSVSKGTVRFQPENPIPASVVKRLVVARLAEIAGPGATKPG